MQLSMCPSCSDATWHTGTAESAWEAAEDPLAAKHSIAAKAAYKSTDMPPEAAIDIPIDATEGDSDSEESVEDLVDRLRAELQADENQCPITLVSELSDLMLALFWQVCDQL